MNSAPVIAIDGPTASGKGTIAQRVASELAFHYLDSGALYRLVAYRALEAGVGADDAQRLSTLAGDLTPSFTGGRILLGTKDVTDAIRSEEVSRLASRIAVHSGVRQALMAMQRSQRQAPGLVADGRDMGTIVFPDATLKVYLTASPAARAARRYRGSAAEACDRRVTRRFVRTQRRRSGIAGVALLARANASRDLKRG